MYLSCYLKEYEETRANTHIPFILDAKSQVSTRGVDTYIDALSPTLHCLCVSDGETFTWRWRRESFFERKCKTTTEKSQKERRKCIYTSSSFHLLHISQEKQSRGSLFLSLPVDPASPPVCSTLCRRAVSRSRQAFFKLSSLKSFRWPNEATKKQQEKDTEIETGGWIFLVWCCPILYELNEGASGIRDKNIHIQVTSQRDQHLQDRQIDRLTIGTKIDNDG